MRQLEGAYYDAVKIKLSKHAHRPHAVLQGRQRRDARRSPAATDQVDVNFTVEEKPTGALLLGAGFSSVDKLIVSGSISQANVFGSGKFVSAQVNTGKVNQTYALSYPNPVLHGRRRQPGLRRLQAHDRRLDARRSAPTSPRHARRRRQVRLSAQRDRLDISFGLTAENVKLETVQQQPARRTSTSSAIFGNQYTYVAGTIGSARDRRDSAILTTRGTLQPR